jgi:hypothetical protein
VIGLLLHLIGVPWALPIATAMAFVAAFLNAAFGLCLGCQLYLLLQRAGILGGRRDFPENCGSGPAIDRLAPSPTDRRIPCPSRAKPLPPGPEVSSKARDPSPSPPRTWARSR